MPLIEGGDITTTIRLRIDCDSTAVRFPFECNSTAVRPFDDLRYDLPVSGLLH